MDGAVRNSDRRFLASPGRAPAWLLLVVATALSGACSQEPVSGQRAANEPPHVWLAAAPPEGSDDTYRVHMFWGGWDPDGEVDHYEYAIADNHDGVFDPADTTGADKWHPVWSNDSTFVFTADVLVDSSTVDPVTRFERSHTFFIRAVDREGLASREPAYRSFTAWTLSPRVTLQVPRRAGLAPALVPPITTFSWKAVDFVNSLFEEQDPDSVRWILHPVQGSDFTDAIEWVRTHPNSDEWYPWTDYRAPQDSGKFWVSPPLAFGNYVFAIQAKDEAGAVTPVFDETLNLRRITVTRRNAGPVLTVFNEFTGMIQTTSPDAPVVIVDMPAGVPLQFRLSADASAYGGVVSGYRYGWDITDLSDPSQWEVDFTPITSTWTLLPVRSFFFGTHTLVVEVVDNSGTTSRVTMRINMIQFAMNRDLLLIDDYFEKPGGSGLGKTNGGVPSDEEHDAFWIDMLSDYAGFNPATDVIQVRSGQRFSIVDVANYKSIIWNAWGGYGLTQTFRPLLFEFIRFRSKQATSAGSAGKIRPNIVSLFMRAGGHLMLCGEQPLTQVIQPDKFAGAPRFPLLFKYELDGNQTGNYSGQVESEDFAGDQSFAYRDACVSVLDVASSGIGLLRRAKDNGCGVRTIRRADQHLDGLRSAEPIDPTFPRLALRPEVAGPGKFYAPENRGLNVELYDPPYFSFCNWYETRSCFQPIYGNGCLDTGSPIYNAPVAGWSTVYADIVPDLPPDGVAARSVFLGFEPFFMEPAQSKAMIDRILADEWGLSRGP